MKIFKAIAVVCSMKGRKEDPTYLEGRMQVPDESRSNPMGTCWKNVSICDYFVVRVVSYHQIISGKSYRNSNQHLIRNSCFWFWLRRPRLKIQKNILLCLVGVILESTYYTIPDGDFTLSTYLVSIADTELY